MAGAFLKLRPQFGGGLNLLLNPWRRGLESSGDLEKYGSLFALSLSSSVRSETRKGMPFQGCMLDF